MNINYEAIGKRKSQKPDTGTAGKSHRQRTGISQPYRTRQPETQPGYTAADKSRFESRHQHSVIGFNQISIVR